MNITKSATFNFTAFCSKIKTTTPANRWKQLSNGMEGEIECKGFEIPNLHDTLLKSGENISDNDIEKVAKPERQ